MLPGLAWGAFLKPMHDLPDEISLRVSEESTRWFRLHVESSGGNFSPAEYFGKFPLESRLAEDEKVSKYGLCWNRISPIMSPRNRSVAATKISDTDV